MPSDSHPAAGVAPIATRATCVLEGCNPALGGGMSPEKRVTMTHGRWRDSTTENTFRFHALRLYEGGLLQSLPEQIIARATDRRFLNAVKREMKG